MFTRLFLKCSVAVMLLASAVAANAAGSGYNMTYYNGIKTITLPPETAAFNVALYSDVATRVCADCHSADYPTTQPYQSRAGWQAVLDKMKFTFGMPSPGTTDEGYIIDYLTANYGI